MMSIFDIDQSLIKATDDEAARELVARLCRAELRAQGLHESAVTWGGNQRAKDGGVDVRVDCPSPLRTPGFLKTARTVIQVKAQIFEASKIRAEIAPQGVLRPAIEELKETRGTYIIVSTQDDLSDLALQPRRYAILECLSEEPLHGFLLAALVEESTCTTYAAFHPRPARRWCSRRRRARPGSRRSRGSSRW